MITGSGSWPSPRCPGLRLARTRPASRKAWSTIASILAGIRYIRSNRLLLGLISLDLFAVLLGGVTALLPIFAKDILAVGPLGLGCLRCAPGVGAAVIGFCPGTSSDRGRRGPTHARVCRRALALRLSCLRSRPIYGFRSAALAAAGGFDMVSMVIRQTLVQIATPDLLRGRVSAVNFVFIGASNELGEFRIGPYRRPLRHRPRGPRGRPRNPRGRRPLGQTFSRTATGRQISNMKNAVIRRKKRCHDQFSS